MNSKSDSELINYGDFIDRNKLADYEKFLHKVNEKWEFQYGLRDTYSDDGDFALNKDVEYFGQFILADDRMRYIIENIVNSNLSPENKICNTIISHFYGARGIHQILTGLSDPKKAHVDFNLLKDKDYLQNIENNIIIAKNKKSKFFGTTELHTSLQTAARNYCRDLYSNSERKAHTSDILQWVSSWISTGVIDSILKSKSLKETYNILTSLPGIGEYYGYHCATSNSVNTQLNFHHNERFCAPGPGARSSLNLIFPNLKDKVKKVKYDELVFYINENQDELFKRPVRSHNFFHNYDVNNSKVFLEDQTKLTVYTTEVSLCQYGVYCHLIKNPHLISKRKVARVDDNKKSKKLFV